MNNGDHLDGASGRPPARVGVDRRVSVRPCGVGRARAKSSQALAQRSRIGWVARQANPTGNCRQGGWCWPQTVHKCRQRFVQSGLDGLADEPRPGGPRKISDEQIEAVVMATLSANRSTLHAGRGRRWPPRAGCRRRRWVGSGRRLGSAAFIDTFKISSDPQFIDKVRDIVGLYLDPPEKALVLCVDQKSQIQALDRSAPVLPMMPRLPERRTHDYLRHGITSLFAALDVATGKVYGSIHRRHRAAEFKKFLTKLGQPNSHRAGCAPDLRQLRHPQDTGDIQLACRPSPVPHALHSDLRLLAQPGRAMVRTAEAPPRHPPVDPGPGEDIREWISAWNKNPKPITWTKTADEILETLASYLQRIPGAGH